MKLKSCAVLAALVLIVLLAMLTGCDKRNAPIVVPKIPSDSLLTIVSMEASTDTIYADNGITFSDVTVLVKDNQHFAAVGVPVLFRTNLGGIIRQVTTDSAGFARTTFYSRGPNETGVARVEAFLRDSQGLTMDSTYTDIHIIPVPAVSNLTLEMNSTALAVDQVVNVQSKARNILGMDVPDKTILTFSASRGYFLNADDTVAGDSVLVQTSHGNATIRYNAGPLAGVGSITVRVGDKSVTRNLTIRPGRAARLEMSSFLDVDGVVTPADEAPINSGNDIYMRALVTDLHNNVVPNVMVRFETDLGTFNSTNTTSNKNTDSLGIADVKFTPGLTSGQATIKGFANGDTLQTQILFTVTSDEIYSIQFENSGQILLDVAHSGGMESAIIRVKLLDQTGNLVETPTPVQFTLLGAIPTGANLGGSGLVTSSGGIAQISVNSGTQSGVLKIEAKVVKEDGAIVRAEKANVVIQAGPPSQIQLDIGGFDTGTNKGGGLWEVVAEALVKDSYGNPVKSGTMVFFSLPTNQPNAWIAATLAIGAAGDTGGESALGDSLAGVAYTTITYNGVYTFESIRVRAETLGANNIIMYSERDLQLPLNGPVLTGVCVPAHVDWTTDTAAKTAIVRVTLKDAQQNPIHRAVITLRSERGTFVWIPGTNIEYPNPQPLQPSPPNQADQIVTDWYNPHYNNHGTTDVDNPFYYGVAEGMISLLPIYCPPPSPDGPGTYTVTITATLESAGLSYDIPCTMNRF